MLHNLKKEEISMDMKAFGNIEGSNNGKGGFGANPNSLAQRCLNAVPFVNAKKAKAVTVEDVTKAINDPEVDNAKVRMALYRLAHKGSYEPRGKITPLLRGFDTESGLYYYARAEVSDELIAEAAKNKVAKDESASEEPAAEEAPDYPAEESTGEESGPGKSFEETA